MCRDQQQANLMGVCAVVKHMASLLCVLTMGLVLALGLSRVAWAEDVPDLPEEEPAPIIQPAATPQEASLMVRYGYTSNGVTKYIDGAQVTIYKVASLDDNINFYTTLDEFKSLGVNFQDGLDANEAQKVADKAAALVEKNKIKGVKTVTTTAQGTASFGTLPYGIYLVVQTGAAGTAKDYYDFDPFFIGVPSLEEDRIVYNVVVEPKTTPRPVVKPPEEKKPLAKTGDMTNPQLWITCLVAGSVLLVGGLVLRRRRTKR